MLGNATPANGLSAPTCGRPEDAECKAPPNWVVRNVSRSFRARRPGGEPLWNEPKDLVIFSPLRGRAKSGVKQAAPSRPGYHQFSLRDGSVVIRLFFQQDTTVCWRGES